MTLPVVSRLARRGALMTMLALIFPAAAPAAERPAAAAAALVRRVLGDRADAFVCRIIPADPAGDVFEIESEAGKIVLRGNNGVAVASALNHYLKHFCQCEISWCGDQLNLPPSLPPPTEKVRIVSPHKWRVYFNYCTLSYTASWWDWDRWQREIDFMALNGVNMPLAPTGLEAVWYNTLLKFKFSDAEARQFLVGPAFSAWQWMQNIEGHCGPLPKSWIDSHAELARKILRRERGLGMTPIQQGFSGHVPRLMKQKFPEAEMKQQPPWCGFPGVMQLDPLDPLFAKFGRAFIEEEIKLYGAGHVYAADPFHESSPPKPGAEYLRQVGRSISKLFIDVDPQALWAMQAWSIRKEIAAAVPKDRLLVLDLGGGRRDFWGYDFVVGQLHNFGGRINLHGDLADVADNKFAAAKKTTANAVGMGLFMEGTTQNPVFYNLVLDMAWRDRPVDARRWVHQYARRRYGAASAAAAEAWDILLETAYKPGTSGVEYSSIIAARPALDVKKSGPNAGFKIPYPPQRLVRAWELLLQDRARLKACDGYRFDVADVARQVLSNLGQVVQKEVARAHVAGDKPAFAKASRQFLDLLSDVDAVCAARNEYNFGKWIGDARRWGATDAEKALYEYNAAMLVTLWGPADDPHIFDYSWREWAGLIRTYYRPRWEMFFQCLAEHPDYREDGLPQVHGREAFRANAFYRQLADWEIAWTKQRHDLPAEPVGDPVELSARLLEKYRPLLDRCYSVQSKIGGLRVANPQADGGPQDYASAPAEDVAAWRQLKFGMFAHWGPVSLTGKEISWSRRGPRRGTGGAGETPLEVYDNLYKQFNPVRFDAREWVAAAKAAGMRYLVFTARHHDGFSMFDSRYSDYKITNPQSPYRRDVVRQLADACHEGGLRWGVYYSQPDWHHPDYRTPNHANYLRYMHAQVRELVSNYGRVDMVFFDGLGVGPGAWDAANLFKIIRQAQPHALINDRCELPGDFGTPEQSIGQMETRRPWETCMTLCEQWAWKPDDQMKSLQQCLQTLVRVAGSDGNLLFNVGPMPDGRIEPRQVQRLREMGQWLARYGESIYGTRGGPFRCTPWGVFTYKDNRVYVHILDPLRESVVLPALTRKIVASRLLTGGTATVRQGPRGIEISVPKANRQEIDSIVLLEFDGPAPQAGRGEMPSGSLAAGKPAKASNVYQNNTAEFGPGRALDDNWDTRWATEWGVHRAWLEVDLGRPQELGRAFLSEECGSRIRRFELQAKQGDGWKTFARGNQVGEHCTLLFSPATARVVRLNILEASEGPTISELQLFPPEDKERPKK